MEQLFLGLGLVGQKLKVVDQQQVHLAVALTEPIHRVRRPFSVSQGGDQIVGELFAGAEAHACLPGLCQMAYGMQEVGLAQAGVGMDEQRGEMARLQVDDLLGGLTNQAVVGADYEGFERVGRIKAVDPRRQRAGLLPRRIGLRGQQFQGRCRHRGVGHGRIQDQVYVDVFPQQLREVFLEPRAQPVAQQIPGHRVGYQKLELAVFVGEETARPDEGVVLAGGELQGQRSLGSLPGLLGVVAGNHRPSRGKLRLASLCT